MTVKQVSTAAATILQAEDILRTLSATTVPADDEGVNTMVKCVNLAAAETYADFPPLVRSTVTAVNGVIPASALSSVAAVRAVRRNGRPVRFTFGEFGAKVGVDGEYEAEYTPKYADKALDDTLVVGCAVDCEMLAYLAARNYCLMTGRSDDASIWDQRYAAEAENKRILRRAYLPGRRFA